MAGLLIRRTISTTHDDVADTIIESQRDILENTLTIERMIGVATAEVPEITEFPFILGRPNCFSHDNSTPITIEFSRWKVYRRNTNPVVFPTYRKYVSVTGRFQYGTRDDVERLCRNYGVIPTNSDRNVLFIANTKGKGKINTALSFSQRILPELALYQMVYYQSKLYPHLMMNPVSDYSLQKAAEKALDWGGMEIALTNAMRE